MSGKGKNAELLPSTLCGTLQVKLERHQAPESNCLGPQVSAIALRVGDSISAVEKRGGGNSKTCGSSRVLHWVKDPGLP